MYEKRPVKERNVALLSHRGPFFEAGLNLELDVDFQVWDLMVLLSREKLNSIWNSILL